MNALLRETKRWQWRSLPAAAYPCDAVADLSVRIGLNTDHAYLWLPVIHRSVCGRHKFRLPLVLQSADHFECIDFLQAVSLITRDSDLLPSISGTQIARFLRRVEQSTANIARALTNRSKSTGLSAIPAAFPDAFISAEQGLLVGHAVHPTPRSREPMSDREALSYAPEFGGRFGLLWFTAAPARLQLANAPGLNAQALFSELYAAERSHSDTLAPLRPGEAAFPMHPWQFEQLRKQPRNCDLFTSENLRPLGTSASAWGATSSLRAVYAPHAPWMLKFSLSLRLTNSLRTLQPAEMLRGLDIYSISKTPVWHEFQSRYPMFKVLPEPAYATLLDAQNKPVIESLVMLRANPFRDGEQSDCAVLAVLTQDQPGDQPPILVQQLRRYANDSVNLTVQAERWFEAFLDVAVEPLLIAQADYGLLFGAHQQNLVLGFEQGLPQRAWFRDCQGTGFSELATELLRPWLPNLGAHSANVLDESMANRLFAYYLIVNSSFGVIAALGGAQVADENHLLGLLRRRLTALLKGPRRDPSCLEYLLESPQIWAKGNFLCAWQEINETTMHDPVSIYHPLNNPLNNPLTKDDL